MATKQPQIDASWLAVLGNEFAQPYMASLRCFLRDQKNQRKIIYPASENWFNAFNATGFEQVKVVILGQDPYHQPGQAHGLCFSVLQDVRIPPSLVNIYKELQQDIGIARPQHGNLQKWAAQGVLLLNATLTVAHGQAGSHQGKGWERFTDSAILALNQQRENLVFLLWGSYAHKKAQSIDHDRHLILQSAHPSPLSAQRGFFGCKHFSKTNQWLVEHARTPIDWSV